MPKKVKKSHKVAEAGINAFATYCNRHQPYILWREEPKNDFGIDGEVESTSDDNGQDSEATGQIFKIQIKSTEKGSYIKNRGRFFGL